MNQLIKEIEAPLLKDSMPELNVGDTVKVFVKIKEGGKERTQGYEGVIIKKAGGGVNETVTVRRVFQGIGIERVFLIHSPRVEKITVQRRGRVRRAKLYYLRKRTGKATRIKEKLMSKKSKEKATAKNGSAEKKKAPGQAQAKTLAPETKADEAETKEG